MARQVLVLGATSAIAQEISKLLARDGDRMFLVARNADKLAIVAADLRVRGAGHVEELVADLDDPHRVQRVFCGFLLRLLLGLSPTRLIGLSSHFYTDPE